MTDSSNKAHLLELFVFETIQSLEQLERLILNSEKSGGLEFAINEVLRVMHTIKGSAAMMLFNDLSSLAHSVEDVFYYLRETKPQAVNFLELTNLVLAVIDYTKTEVDKVKNGEAPDRDSSELKEQIKTFLVALKETDADSNSAAQSVPEDNTEYRHSTKKTRYKVCVIFDEDCGMENIRAFTLIHALKDFAEDIDYEPANILENSDTAEIIRHEGLNVVFATTNSRQTIEEFFAKTMFLKELKINAVDAGTGPMPKEKKTIDLDGPIPADTAAPPVVSVETNRTPGGIKQRFISVNVEKMDLLMDLVGEMVIAEAMVTQNPELEGLTLDKFHKATRQLRKITSELQNIVMSIRMVELSATFHKMNRIVRDMNKRLNKQVELEIHGEETEVDKNIIEQISDPLMHLIRNSVDHGIESAQERLAKGKPEIGTIRLEAKNAGGDVLVILQDDGGGLNKEKILAKARERGLVQKEASELTDKEIFSFIFQPGFSTKDAVTEFSGRGVGMDVVAKNLERIGGKVSVDSVAGQGTTMTIRIPLTLAIIDGMKVSVGNTIYTIPTIAIRESFQLKDHKVIKDMDNHEMVMIRGHCYPIIRLHERFGVKTSVTDLPEGIMVIIEDGGKGLCLFADSLLGQQQVVVKALPPYIKKTQGIAGCTLLGEGSVSLILDVAGLVQI